MKRRIYPSRNELPVPVEELHLAPSSLDSEETLNLSNHHMLFPIDRYRNDLIFASLRNLERLQVVLLRDQHMIGRTALHSLYRPPVVPSHKKAMEVLEETFLLGEKFKVWDPEAKTHTLIPFSEEHWEALKKGYDKKNEKSG